MAKSKFIVFTAGVNTRTANLLKAELVKAVTENFEELHILISSGGGNVFEGLSLAAFIKALPLKVVMHNIGQIDSVALVIFAAGKERYSNTNSSFLFHGIKMEHLQPISFNEQDLHEQYKIAKRCREDIAKNFSAYIGMPIEEITELMVNSSILSAAEAEIKGIINGISDAAIPRMTPVVSIGDM